MNSNKVILAILVLIATICLASLMVVDAAVQVYVDASAGNDTASAGGVNNGQNQAEPAKTIQHVLAQYKDTQDVTITVKPGTYQLGSLSFTRASEFTLRWTTTPILFGTYTTNA